MNDLLHIAQENSRNATKGKEDYSKMIFEAIDEFILRASNYKGITDIFLAQISPKVYQAMYRENNSPLYHEYNYTYGTDPVLLSLDDNFLTLDEIVDHYARLGFLSGIQVFKINYAIQYRLVISWSDEESIDDKVNMHKYVNGEDIFKKR